MKKLLAMVLALAMLLTLTVPAAAADASVETYKDMPQGWSHDAVAAAVANGLLQGDNGCLDPAGYLTRAQAAAILVRAFGGTAKADISGFTDVSKDAWYYDELSTAVAMGLFAGSGSKLCPNDRITREQTALVLSRALWLMDAEADLTGYTDAGSVSSWAKDGVCAMVKAGYLKGSGEKLSPGAYITREEFAQMLYNMVSKYDGETGTFDGSVDGNLVVRAENVTLSGAKITGDLIVGDGAGDSTVTVQNCTIGGRLIIRGGGANSVVVTNTKLNQVVAARPDGPVHFSADAASKPATVYAMAGSGQVIFSGSMGALVVNTQTPVVLDGATVEKMTVGTAKAAVTVAAGSTVADAAIMAGADNATLTVNGTVSNVTTNADKATIAGSGTVKAVLAAAASAGTVVKTAQTAITNKSDSAVTTTSGEVAGGSTGSTNSSGGVTSSSSGGGGSSSHTYYYKLTMKIDGLSSVVGGTLTSTSSSTSLASSTPFYTEAIALMQKNETALQHDTTLWSMIEAGYSAYHDTTDWNTFVSNYESKVTGSSIENFKSRNVTLGDLFSSSPYTLTYVDAAHTYTVTITITRS